MPTFQLYGGRYPIVKRTKTGKLSKQGKGGGASSQKRGKSTSAKNLKPKRNAWPSGVSGNPNGAPSTIFRLSPILRNRLREPAVLFPFVARIAKDMDLDPKVTTIGAVLCSRWIMRSMIDSDSISSMIMNRMDGAVPIAQDAPEAPPEIGDGLTDAQLRETAMKALERDKNKKKENKK